MSVEQETYGTLAKGAQIELGIGIAFSLKTSKIQCQEYRAFFSVCCKSL